MRWRARSAIAGYFMAVLLTALAVGLCFTLDGLLGVSHPLILLFPAVAVSAWIGGYRPALLTAILGYVLCDYFFIAPRGQLGPLDAKNMVGLVIYLASCALIIALETSTRHTYLRGVESQARFISFMRHLPGLAWIKDAQGRYLYLNDAAEKAFGKSREELLGKSDAEIFPAPTAEQFVKNDELARVQEGGVQVVESLTHPDGVTHHSIVSKFPLATRGKNASYVAGVAFDITERIDAEEKLRHHDQQLRFITDHAPLHLIHCDANARYIFANASYCRRFGLTLDDIVGKHISEVLGAKAYATFEHHVKAVLQGERVEFEVDIPYEDFGPRWMHCVYVPELTPTGQTCGFVAVVQDITQRRAAEQSLRESEEALRAANRRKDEFLATLAHELRNPLAPIRASLELMKTSSLDPRLVEQARNTIDRHMLQMERLIEDLLDVSRITRNRPILRKEPTLLATVAASAVETIQPLAQAARHRVEVSLPPEPLMLDGDPVRLTQILSNLLHNACKYTPAGGRIALAAERSDGQVQITVKDNGIGIRQEMIPHIFEMFTQADRSPDRPQGGLGIGLCLVKQLAELHGGGVEARSDGLGAGSAFIVHLPLCAAALAPLPAAEKMSAPNPPLPSTVSAASRRVLVVDDNRDAATTLTLLLRTMGHEVQTAFDGEEGLAVAESFLPEIVLLDIGLPKINGYDVARRIRQSPWGGLILLVALTGWGSEEDRQKTSAAGFDFHLVKPVSHSMLLSVLGGRSSA